MSRAGPLSARSIDGTACRLTSATCWTAGAGGAGAGAAGAGVGIGAGPVRDRRGQHGLGESRCVHRRLRRRVDRSRG